MVIEKTFFSSVFHLWLKKFTALLLWLRLWLQFANHFQGASPKIAAPLA